MNSRNLAALVLSILIGAGISIAFALHLPAGTLFGAFEPGNSLHGSLGAAATGLLGFSLTLVGVVLGAFYRRLVSLREQGQSSVAFGKLWGDVANSVDLWIGAIAAPIVFGLLWQSLGTLQLAPFVVITLQNGFVANSLVAQVAAGKPPAPA